MRKFSANERSDWFRSVAETKQQNTRTHIQPTPCFSGILMLIESVDRIIFVFLSTSSLFFSFAMLLTRAGNVYLRYFLFFSLILRIFFYFIKKSILNTFWKNKKLSDSISSKAFTCIVN